MKHTRMKLKTVVKNLHEGWKFRQARLTNWYPATVPGVVHTDLLQNKIIEDPFFRLNERGLQWIDKEDIIFNEGFGDYWFIFSLGLCADASGVSGVSWFLKD